MPAAILHVGPRPRIALEMRGAGPLVVLLHGIGGNRHAWARQVPAVGAEFTVVAWDARGYGDSDDYDGALQFTDFGDDLARVLDHFGVRAAHIVGSSMGGRIALDFVTRFADRVATLTLADCSAGSAKVASPTEVDKFLALRKQPLLDGKSPREIAPLIAESLIGPGTGPDAYAVVVAALSALHRESYLKTLDTVTRYGAFPPFEHILTPTLVMVGEHDRIAKPAYMANMAARIAGSRFVEIPGASHVSNIDRPHEFNEALLDFLRKHRDRADAPNARMADRSATIAAAGASGEQ